ncbi:ribonuclease P protein component [Thiomicrorhabdus aquaedulcis]|uniref:ribonuclease P protein component n=1 Tax=Thiomicrorhabdus aquaedulcis TaxID=2211106 RepID=UPI000FD87A47|nr:ribonuclease P protein component [Thiomicrorhabdus aquaedulcis]
MTSHIEHSTQPDSPSALPLKTSIDNTTLNPKKYAKSLLTKVNKVNKPDLSNGFSKSYRLLAPKEFQHVFAQAEKFANRNWTLIVRPNHEPIARLGLAVAKKQLQRAVWRNRVKRIAREAFRLHKESLSGYDIVVLGRKGMQDIDSETLHTSFLHLIRKIRHSGFKDRT